MFGIATLAIAVFAVQAQGTPAKIDAPQEIMSAVGPYGNCLAEHLNAGLKRAQASGGMTAEQLEAHKVDVFARCETAKRTARANADDILEEEGVRSRQARQETIDRALNSIEQSIQSFGKSG